MVCFHANTLLRGLFPYPRGLLSEEKVWWENSGWLISNEGRQATYVPFSDRAKSKKKRLFRDFSG
jgi:hypothetical protein